MLRILALDPATKTGWAHSSGVSGVWDLSVRRDESAGMGLLRLQAKLNEIRLGVGVDVVVFEAARNARPGGQGALVSQARKQGIIELWCEEHGIEYRGYSPSEIKRHATGKGNAGKSDVILSARERWGLTKILDDNHADALWLLDLAQRELGENQCSPVGGATAS